MTTSTKAIAALTFTVLVWALTPVMVRSLSVAMGPYELLVVRLILSGVIYAAISVFSGGMKFPRKDMPRLLLISFIGLLGYFSLSTFGYAYVTAGIGTLIMSTQPMLIALFAWLVGTDQLTPRSVIGLIIAFAGSALLVSSDDVTGGAISQRDLLFGGLLIFAAGLAWAIHVVYSRSLIQKHGALNITCLANMLIALPALPFLSSDMISKAVNLKPDAMWALVLLHTLGTASVITWNIAAGHARPTLVGASLYVVTVLAVFAGWFFLGEAITPMIILAALVIFSGVALSQWKTAK
jgi:drug/metabolite transporter (DMT)-like permease